MKQRSTSFVPAKRDEPKSRRIPGTWNHFAPEAPLEAEVKLTSGHIVRGISKWDGLRWSFQGKSYAENAVAYWRTLRSNWR